MGLRWLTTGQRVSDTNEGVWLVVSLAATSLPRLGLKRRSGALWSSTMNGSFTNDRGDRARWWIVERGDDGGSCCTSFDVGEPNAGSLLMEANEARSLLPSCFRSVGGGDEWGVRASDQVAVVGVLTSPRHVCTEVCRVWSSGFISRKVESRSEELEVADNIPRGGRML